jgi:hypothetical protein
MPVTPVTPVTVQVRRLRVEIRTRNPRNLAGQTVTTPVITPAQGHLVDLRLRGLRVAKRDRYQADLGSYGGYGGYGHSHSAAGRRTVKVR